MRADRHSRVFQRYNVDTTEAEPMGMRLFLGMLTALLSCAAMVTPASAQSVDKPAVGVEKTIKIHVIATDGKPVADADIGVFFMRAEVASDKGERPFVGTLEGEKEATVTKTDKTGYITIPADCIFYSAEDTR